MFRNDRWIKEFRYYSAKKLLTDFDLCDVPNKRRNAKYITVPKKIKQTAFNIHSDFYKRIEWILGVSIFEHELVVNHKETIECIKKCHKISDIVDILHERYKRKYNKKLSLPGRSRNFYRKHKNENNKLPKIKGVKNTNPLKKKKSLVGDYLKRHSADVCLSVNTNTPRKPAITFPDWVKRYLEEPEPNFHEK